MDDKNIWRQLPNLGLPSKYNYLQTNRSNPLWRRHFKFPFQGQHSNVKFTYDAKLWKKGEEIYSFLPYAKDGKRVSFEISSLSNPLVKRINTNINGKIPLDMTDTEVAEIINKINQLAFIKVLRDIK